MFDCRKVENTNFFQSISGTVSTGFLTVGCHPILKQKCAIAKGSPVITMTSRLNIKALSCSCCSSTRKTRIQTLAFMAVGCFYILSATISSIVFASSVVIFIITPTISFPVYKSTSRSRRRRTCGCRSCRCR